MTDDDLTPFRDDPLLLALRAPGTDDELAGEDAALAMFRQSLPARRRRRRAITRVTIGGAGIVLGLTMTTGVAAAYTTGLPDPVQDAVHTVLDPLPIPAPPTAHALRIRHRQQVAKRRAEAQRRQTEKEAQQGVAPGRTGRVTPRPTPAPNAFQGPTSGGQPQPSAAPEATPSPVRATMTVAVSRRVVPVHHQVTLTGRLTRGSAGLADRTVYAAELPAGESTWRRVARAQTAADGTVSLTVPPLTTNVRLRLVSGQGVTSSQLPVAVVPTLTLAQSQDGTDRAVTVTADGGQPGNTLVLFRRDGDAWTQIATTTLAGDGTGSFVVPGPGSTRVRYLVRLRATAKHAATAVQFLVPARAA